MGDTGDMLLLGADNQNVPDWASNGYAERGSSRVRNQETTRRIPGRKLTVGVSTLEFRPDWTTRALPSRGLLVIAFAE